MTNPNRFKEALDRMDNLRSRIGSAWSETDQKAKDAEFHRVNNAALFLDKNCYAAITEALSLAQSGYVLPELPKGWRYLDVRQSHADFGGRFLVIIRKHEIVSDLQGEGSTPYEAAQQAIERITEKKL